MRQIWTWLTSPHAVAFVFVIVYLGAVLFASHRTIRLDVEKQRLSTIKLK